MRAETSPHHEVRSRHAALLGFSLLFGAALGATLALLMAPKAGVVLRRDVANSVSRMKRQAADVADRGRRAWNAGRDAFTTSARHPKAVRASLDR